MPKHHKTSNRRQHDFRVVARGIRQRQPDIRRLAQVALAACLAAQSPPAKDTSTRERPGDAS
jgi:hypothetical protein